MATQEQIDASIKTLKERKAKLQDVLNGQTKMTVVAGISGAACLAMSSAYTIAWMSPLGVILLIIAGLGAIGSIYGSAEMRETTKILDALA